MGQVEDMSRPDARDAPRGEVKEVELKDVAPTPVFFVSVASKGFSISVSALE
jgi:hypothetical protein